MLKPLQLTLQNPADAAVPDAAEFERWLTATLDAAGEHRRDITVRVVDCAEIRTLNRDYRNKDTVTNVLSFPFDGPREIEPDLLGDIVICAEVIDAESAEQGKQTLAHWGHMVVHGTLHLCGYDHIEENEACEMEALEVNILGTMGIPDPYQSVG